MDNIALGTVGSGKIVHHILDNAEKTDSISLEAVYSRTIERAAELGAEYGAKKEYTDFDAFLADPGINTVYVATPNSLHYGQCRAALLAGKNVICEKPFVTSMTQAEELASIADDSDLMLIEAAPTSFLPNFRILEQNLPAIGKIRLVISNYSKYSSRYDALLRGEKPNIFSPELAGGCLMDINYYNILLNVLLFGAPERAGYHCSIYPGMTDTSGTAVLEYDGFVSSNTGAKDTWGVNFFQIEGENGFIYIDGGSNGITSVRVVTGESDITYNEQDTPDRWYYEVREIARIMLAGDRAAIRKRMSTTIETVALLEKMRKEAGLFL